MEKTHQRIIFNFEKALKGLVSGLVLLSALLPFDAYAREIKLISDEETEQFLAEVISPLFKAAEIPFYRNNIFIVEDNSLNAFVSDGNRMFVHTGTIIKSDTANELSGVLAHETGHIMGGHIIRQKLKAQDMYEVSMISAILAGAAAAVSGRGDAAMAVMLGGQSSLINHYTHYRTEEERSADEAAIKLLNATQQSPIGILNFMKKIKKENIMEGREETPYFRTHPITNDRIHFFENALANSPYKQISQNDFFLRVKAKIKAYLQKPEQTFKEYPLSRTDTPAVYAQAIAYMKKLDFEKALNKIDVLILQDVNNPFFYELKGQIYLETGKIKQAKQNFAKAYEILPNSHLMQINYAHAILEDNPSIEDAKKAITLLNKTLHREQSITTWMLLAKAYGIIGDMGKATYVSAEYSFRMGNLKVAKKQLETAKKYKTDAKLKLKIDDLEHRLKTMEKNN